jgi:tetratricopeptide (TPR) repeat protein
MVAHAPATRFVYLLALLVMALTESAAARHAVQLSSDDSSSIANARKAELVQEFPGALFVFFDGETYKLCLGAFDYYVDALLVRNALAQDPRFTGAFIRNVEGADAPTLEALDFVPSIFDLYGKKASEAQVFSLSGNSVYETLENIDKTRTDDEYRQALLNAFPNHESSDPLRGYIQTNLGILSIKAGEMGTARRWVEPVATGQVASAASHRVMAMIRVAWLMHREGDRLGAYQAYQEIAAYTSSDAVRARSMVECAGLLMELAESAKGSHMEVQRYIRTSLEEISASDIKRRATLDLMYSETFGRQLDPDYLMAATLSEELVLKYSQYRGTQQFPEREVATALYQAGMYHRQAGNWEKARRCYERVLEEFTEDVDHFAGRHPYAQAMYGLARVARHEGDDEAYSQIVEDIVRLFPDAKVVERSASNISILERVLQ